jgi:hypothetical protein
MRGVSKFYPNKPTSIEFTLLVGVGGFDLDMVCIQQMLSHKPAHTVPITANMFEFYQRSRSTNTNFNYLFLSISQFRGLLMIYCLTL